MNETMSTYLINIEDLQNEAAQHFKKLDELIKNTSIVKPKEDGKKIIKKNYKYSTP